MDDEDIIEIDNNEQVEHVARPEEENEGNRDIQALTFAISDLTTSMIRVRLFLSRNLRLSPPLFNEMLGKPEELRVRRLEVAEQLGNQDVLQTVITDRLWEFPFTH